MQDSPYTIHSSDTVWQCPWWSVRRDQISTPSGAEGEFYYMEKSKCVFVLPITQEGQVVMIRQYRIPVTSWCWEIPAGGVKQGQTLEQAAALELKEEVGGSAEKIEYIGQFFTSNGTTNEESFLYIATGVTLGEPDREELEIMETHLKTPAEVLQMLDDSEIKDAPSAMALMLSKQYLEHIS